MRAPVLIQAAEEIGVDAFVSMWKMVDELENDGAWLRLPSFSRLERYKRNEMIAAMAADGMDAGRISRRLKSIDIQLSQRSIQMILKEERDDE